MTLDWIIERLKIDGKGTKQEIINALENATAEDLAELAKDCITKGIKLLVPEGEQNEEIN